MASDRYGRKPVLLWPRVALLVLTYPAFLLLIEYTSFFTLACVTSLLALLTARITIALAVRDML